MSKKLRIAFVTAFAVLLLTVALVLPASAATSISNAVITYKTSYAYTGSEIKPAITVKVSDKTLTSSDYTVTYSNNKSIGTGTIKITGKGNYTGTVTKTFTITPAAVKNVKATATTNKITLTWTKGTGVTAYQVYMYNDATGKWVKKATTTGKTASVSNLEPGTVYKFLVRAYTKSTKYLYSPYTSVSAKTTVARVTGATFTSYANSAKISWSAVENANGYQIYVYDSAASKWVRKKTVKTNSGTLTGLTSATEYKVRVRAYNNLDSKLVYGSFSSTLLVTTKPGAVKNLSVTAYTSTTATLKWNKVARATGYYIYVGRSDDPSTSPTYKKTKYVTTTSVTLTGLHSCGYYSFRVLPCYKNSVKKNFYGAYGQTEPVFTPVEKISSFRVAETANNYAVVTWKALPTATGYYLYMRTNEQTSTTLVATLSSGTTTYKFTNLQELTGYRFYIRAYYQEVDGTIIKGSTSGAMTTTDDGKVDSVAFTTTKKSIYVGYNFKFESEVSPYYATNKKVTYSSSNKDVAIVYSNGRVVGLKEGTVVITVKTADGGFKDSVTVKIVPVKSKSISVPSKIVAYPGETKTITPTFTPAKTTDKTFKITGQNHTYTYKGGILGLTTYTDTLKFSDYVTVTSTGKIIGVKNTVEPETGKAFSFKITVTANDTGVKDTAYLSVTDRPMTLSYKGNTTPWYCGNSAKLSVNLTSTAGFGADNVVWESSDASVATVASDGTVNCVGSGAVTITAYSPDGLHNAEYPLYVKPKIDIEKSFFSGCKAGDEYTLSISVKPSDTEYAVSALSSDVVSVDADKVTFLKEGTAKVYVSAEGTTEIVVFTSEQWTQPALDSQSLLTLATEKLNSIKVNKPKIIRYDQTDYTNFYIADTSSAITADDLRGIFSEFASASSARVVESVKAENYSTTAEYNTACGKYYTSVPVSGYSSTVLSSFGLGDIRSIEYIDSDSPTYDIKLTVRDEMMTTDAAANNTTSHGKIFDILSGSYINNVITTLNSGSDSTLGSISASYSNFAQNYYDSTVTVTVDKVTGNVEYVDYDMNISINITKLKLSMGILNALNSDLSFNVHNNVELDVIN